LRFFSKYSNTLIHQRYGGIFVIDGIQQKTCRNSSKTDNDFMKYCQKTLPIFDLPVDLSVGTPRYRHLSKALWYTTFYSFYCTGKPGYADHQSFTQKVVSY
jgi:hypothetical protein